ncbi:hypothetical protein [Aurantibacillus circumpalustris]|nr:hypothetical protein [Aurantibacillus circumpalustris]
MENKNLNKKETHKIIKYIVGSSKHLSEKTKASAKWQKETSDIFASLGL